MFTLFTNFEHRLGQVSPCFPFFIGSLKASADAIGVFAMQITGTAVINRGKDCTIKAPVDSCNTKNYAIKAFADSCNTENYTIEAFANSYSADNYAIKASFDSCNSENDTITAVAFFTINKNEGTNT